MIELVPEHNPLGLGQLLVVGWAKIGDTEYLPVVLATGPDNPNPSASVLPTGRWVVSNIGWRGSNPQARTLLGDLGKDVYRAMVPVPHPPKNCGPMDIALNPGDTCPTCGTVIMVRRPS